MAINFINAMWIELDFQIQITGWCLSHSGRALARESNTLPLFYPFRDFDIQGALFIAYMPAAIKFGALQGDAAGSTPSQSTVGVYLQSPNPASVFQLKAASISQVGGGQQHNNMMPFLCITFIIALVAIFPSRT